MPDHRRKSTIYTPPPISPARTLVHVVWDFIIIVIALLSLGLICFDWLYHSTPLPTAINTLLPALNQPAAWLAMRVDDIDLIFVSIFVIDILAGWAMAIIEQRYHRWFFYPFVHWYDVLGSLPIAGLRWLRILRIIGLLVRLQRRGTIDVRGWYSYTFFHKYYDILMEELSDRIAAKLLTNAQEDIHQGNNLMNRIINDVLKPRREHMIATISDRLIELIDTVSHRHRADLERYLVVTTRSVLQQNPSVRRLKALPFGESVTNTLESSLVDVVRRLVRETDRGLRSYKFKQSTNRIVAEVFDNALKDPALSEKQFNDLLIEGLQVIKEEVEVKRWKDRYEDNDT